MSGGYIKKNKFVRAGFVIDFCNLNRVARVAEIDKIYSLYNSAAVYIEARNYLSPPMAMKFFSMLSPTLPLFSG